MSQNDKGLLRFFAIFGIIIILCMLLGTLVGGVSLSRDYDRLAYMAIMAVIVSASLASGNMGEKAKHLLIWAMIFLFSMIGYSYRAELTSIKTRLLSELIPGRGQTTLHSARYPVSANGHYYIEARIKGTPVLFLTDTGASTIVLSPRDAKRVGLDLKSLTYDRFFQTANGIVKGASVRLDSFTVGALTLNDISASVNQVPLAESLLGMTFFETLHRYEVKDGVLTIYWK